MYTSKELEEFAERYAAENSSPFLVPDELDLDFYEDPQAFALLADLASSVGRPTGEGDDSQRVANGTEPKGDRADALGPASNTGPVKYHFPTGWGGYDGGCEASFSGEWDPNFFPGLAQKLDRARRAADDGDAAGSYISFGGFVWLVRAAGASVGFYKYKYVMESHGVKLYIHSNPKTNIPPVCVRFGFECLARTDLFRAVDTLKDCLAAEGFILKEEKISRVDMQVMLLAPITDFVQAVQAGPRVCTRCRGTFHIITNLKT